MDEDIKVSELKTPEVKKEVKKVAGKIKISPSDKEARYQEHLKRVKGPAKVGDWPKK